MKNKMTKQEFLDSLEWINVDLTLSETIKPKRTAAVEFLNGDIVIYYVFHYALEEVKRYAYLWDENEEN
jgi:hypothetical protein